MGALELDGGVVPFGDVEIGREAPAAGDGRARTSRIASVVIRALVIVRGSCRMKSRRVWICSGGAAFAIIAPSASTPECRHRTFGPRYEICPASRGSCGRARCCSRPSDPCPPAGCRRGSCRSWPAAYGAWRWMGVTSVPMAMQLSTTPFSLRSGATHGFHPDERPVLGAVAELSAPCLASRERLPTSAPSARRGTRSNSEANRSCRHVPPAYSRIARRI